jgi:hypothetical protein
MVFTPLPHVKIKALFFKFQVPTYKIPNLNFQISAFEVSGVGCQVSGKRNIVLKPETFIRPET